MITGFIKPDKTLLPAMEAIVLPIIKNFKPPIMTPVPHKWLSGPAFLMAVVLLFSTMLKAQPNDSSHRSASVQIFYSKILGEQRKIHIITPAHMNPYDRYPVLYFLDAEAHAGLVGGQVQYLSEAYKVIPNLILVGIENTDRTRDLTPTHSIIGPDGKPDTSARAFGKNSGGGEAFLQFMKEELMPYMEHHYTVAPYRIFYGHSLGGLMALHCMVHHPDYFNAYIAISPSLQWDDAKLLRETAEKMGPEIKGNRIVFFSDAGEGPAFHQNQLKLDSLLKKKHVAGLRYGYRYYPEETHISEPVKAFYDGLRLVYPDWHLPYGNNAFRQTMTSTVIKNHFDSLTKIYGYPVYPLHDEVIQLSRFLRNDPKRIRDAIDLLQSNLEHYPASAVMLETLGDTFLKSGDNSHALASFRKALQLDPSGMTIKEKIQQLEK
jgi:predicted alpha/beta superfamily hydrolase